MRSSTLTATAAGYTITVDLDETDEDGHAPCTIENDETGLIAGHGLWDGWSIHDCDASRVPFDALDEALREEMWSEPRKPGRPTVEDTARSARLRVWVTPDALDRWRAAAELEGETLADAVRERLDAWAERVLDE